jgi:hypothetical protein
MSTLNQQIFITIQAVILFVIFSSPATYKIMRKVLGPVIAGFDGVPRPTGIALHATLFGLVTLWLMRRSKKSGYMGPGGQQFPFGIQFSNQNVVQPNGAMAVQGQDEI